MQTAEEEEVIQAPQCGCPKVSEGAPLCTEEPSRSSVQILKVVSLTLRGVEGRRKEAKDQVQTGPRRGAGKCELEQAKAPPKKKQPKKAAAEKRKAAAEPEVAHATKGPRKSAPLTAAEAVAQAAAEGLTLQTSGNVAGYRGVYKESSHRHQGKPFRAKVWRAGKQELLGNFATAEEAALAYARTPEAQAEVANPKPAPSAAAERQPTSRLRFFPSVELLAAVDEHAPPSPEGKICRSSPPTQAEYEAAPRQAAAVFNFMR